jgi:hypothetical protein
MLLTERHTCLRVFVHVRIAWVVRIQIMKDVSAGPYKQFPWCLLYHRIHNHHMQDLHAYYADTSMR